MTKSTVQGNVDGAESIELLSSFKKMYKENKKANKVEKKYMRDILLDGIVVEINNCDQPKENVYDRENENTINDNFVFYVCGILVNRRRNGYPDCFATLNGAHRHPKWLYSIYKSKKWRGAISLLEEAVWTRF